MYILIEGARNYERKRKKTAWTIRTMGVAAIICGACSFSYHMSYTKFFQFFDYLGVSLSNLRYPHPFYTNITTPYIY